MVNNLKSKSSGGRGSGSSSSTTTTTTSTSSSDTVLLKWCCGNNNDDDNNTKRVLRSQRCNWWQMVLYLTVVLYLMVLMVSGGPLPDPRKSDSETVFKLNPRPEWTIRKSKSSECKLGGERHVLNSTWSPNLGPPFGIWSCVKCTCVPVQKKRRVVGRVQCRNIKTECPKLTCIEPTLVPGACCKSCPINHNRRELYARDPPEKEDELTGNDFAVLLNGRTSQSPIITDQLSTGRLSLRRGTLHFSFMLGDNTPAPSLIMFLRKNGDILEELEAQPTPYEATNNRICGTWTRVPRQYRDLLRKEELWVALVPSAVGFQDPSEIENAISGRVARYTGVDTEVFSAMLAPNPSAPPQELPGGGTAIISVSAFSHADSLHVHLVFNGIFPPHMDKNATINVELNPTRGADSVTDKVVLEKIYVDLNHAKLLTTLGETTLRLLTRGKVKMRVWAEGAKEYAIQGDITARATCNVYSTVLTEQPSALAKVPGVAPLTYGSGWALLTVSNEGDFHYQVLSGGLATPVTSVELRTTHRKKFRQVDDLTTNYVSGWTNGSYDRPTYSDLDALLRGRLELVVASSDGEALTGHFTPVTITEALRSPKPILLSSPYTWLAATVWVAVDVNCVMHYDIMIAGDMPESYIASKEVDLKWHLHLRENDTTWDPRLDQKTIILEGGVQGRGLSAHSTILTEVSLTRLYKNVSYIDLSVLSPDSVLDITSSMDTPMSILTGRIEGVDVPEKCQVDSDGVTNIILLKSMDCKKFPKPPDCILDGRIDIPPISKKCIDDKKNVFDQGASWASPVSVCERCMCAGGRIHCHTEPCPHLGCLNPITLPGQCCPSCPVTGMQQNCTYDKKAYYPVGSSWYPFIPPVGFDQCVTCSCTLSSDGEPLLRCPSVKCPVLKCAFEDTQQVKGSCCPVCLPPTTPNPLIHSGTKAPPGVMGHPKISRSKEDKRRRILDTGGCIDPKPYPLQKKMHENGDRWHPRILSMGFITCVTCSCKDGTIDCKHHKADCPKLFCKTTQVEVLHKCCPQCTDKPRPRQVYQTSKPFKPWTFGNKKSRRINTKKKSRQKNRKHISRS